MIKYILAVKKNIHNGNLRAGIPSLREFIHLTLYKKLDKIQPIKTHIISGIAIYLFSPSEYLLQSCQDFDQVYCFS